MTAQTTPQTQDRPFEHQVVVLLVDDQPIIGEAVRRMLADQDDIALHYCQDPKQALAKAAEIGPTVILQDLIMPDIDGLDLVRDYRQQETTRDTPLIVLSTKEEAVTKAEAFARGANDYLVKLPDPVEVVARIRYHSRGYIALLERREAFEALARSQKALQDELDKAADYVRSLLPEPLDGSVTTHSKFLPSASLGGDAFDYQWIDEDHLAICLLDVCGHGVGSALLSISAINTLRSRTLPNTDFADPSSVLMGLNRAFQMERQNYMFFTMWYGVYSQGQRKLRFAGAGHPPALLYTQMAGDRPQLLTAEAPMIGVDLDAEFPSGECDIAAGDQLFVYSDGVFEIPKTDGTMWDFDGFLEFMSTPPAAGTERIEHLVTHTRQLQGGDDFTDDFSIVQVVF